MNNSKPNIILIGAGGHCVSVIDVIEQENKYNILGILDSNNNKDNVLGYPVLGGDELISTLINDNNYFLITVGQIKSFSVRQNIANNLEINKGKLAIVISPQAYVSKYSSIQDGSIIMNGAIINAKSKIGKHCIINTKSNIEHGAVIGDFCHISTCAVVNGDSVIGKGTFVGSNATVSNGIIIKENSVISAGIFVK
jgi:sugar O-acyltransferase (sialic acid O-acetyltransferase NeuD family)